MAVVISATQITIPSAGGVDFSASAVGSPTSSILDDYEEVTATATATPGTSGTITLNLNTWNQTKIGNTVYVSCLLSVASVSSPVGTTITFSGLTYTAGAGTGTNRSGFGVNYLQTLKPAYIVQSTNSVIVTIDASTVLATHQFYFDFSYKV